MTGNSHHSNASHTVSDKIPEEGEEGTDAPKPSRKEKSVLQSKLTKLAIQIGYGGTY